MTDTLTYEQRMANDKAEAKAKLLSLAPALQAAGYDFLVAYFDGSGDDGQIENIFVHHAEEEDAVYDARYPGEIEDGDDLPAGITAVLGEDEIEAALWMLCPDGFENNAGGFGAIILNAQTGTVKVNYSYRVEDSIADDYEV